MKTLIALIQLVALLMFIPDSAAFQLFQHSGEYHDVFTSYYEVEAAAPDTNEVFLHWNYPQNIPFNINSDGCPGLNFNSVINAVKAGFQEWEDVGTGISFSYYGTTQDTLDATDNMTTVCWGTYEGWSEDGIAITLLTYNTSTLVISDVDLFLSEERNDWSFDGDDNHDVQSIITHEVGHLIGIGHSDLSAGPLQDPEDHELWPTMWDGYLWTVGFYPMHENLSERRSLAQDDVNAAEWLDEQYGSSAKPAIPQPRAVAENSVIVFPNPANPTSNINYTIAEPSNVVLDIYSPSGQKVAALVDDHRPAGAHTAVFDGAGMASGIYFYQFQSKSFSTTGKLLIVK